MGAFDPSLATALSIVSKSGWFASRSDEFRARIGPIGRIRRYSVGESLYSYGDEPNGIFGLVDGGLDVAIPRADGVEVTIHRADPGYWIGDLALFADQTRLVSVIAAVPTIVVHFPQQELRKLVDTFPELYPDFYALSYENTGLALRLLANLVISPSEARVAVRLLMYDSNDERIEINISQNKLAELVALSVPTLQRVLKRFQDENLIKVGYGRIEILSRSGLISAVSNSS